GDDDLMCYSLRWASLSKIGLHEHVVDGTCIPSVSHAKRPRIMWPTLLTWGPAAEPRRSAAEHVYVSLCSSTIADGPSAGKTSLWGDLAGDLLGAGPHRGAPGRPGPGSSL